MTQHTPSTSSNSNNQQYQQSQIGPGGTYQGNSDKSTQPAVQLQHNGYPSPSAGIYGTPSAASNRPMSFTGVYLPPQISTNPGLTPNTSSSTPSTSRPSFPSFPTPTSSNGPARTPSHSFVPPRTSPLPFPGQVNAVPGPSTRPVSILEKESLSRKRKWDTQGYTPDEQQHLEERSNQLQLSLLLDQEETINASAGRFTSYEDMVDRLLPWHVWQIHDEELEMGKKAEGTRGVAIAEKEKVEAANIVARMRRINDRFAIARRREGNPNRKTFDTISLINMTKDSINTVRSNLTPLQTQLQGLETTLRGHQDTQRRIEAERKRVMDEEMRRRNKIMEDQRKAKEAKDAKDAKEAKEAEELRIANEKKIAAAAALAAATPATKGKGKAQAAETPESAAKGKQAPKGKGKARGGKTATPSLRETVLTQQSTSTPASPAPLAPSAPVPKLAAITPGPSSPAHLPVAPSIPSAFAATAPKPSIPATVAPKTSVATPGPSIPPTITPKVSPTKPTSATPAPTIPNRPVQPNTALANGNGNGNKPPQAPITLVMKLPVLPQLIRLGILAMPQSAAAKAANPQPPCPAFIKGPVPNSTTGDVYLQVQLAMCSAQQLQGLAKALNIVVADAKAGIRPGGASNPGSPAPLPPTGQTQNVTTPGAPASPAPVPLQQQVSAKAEPISAPGPNLGIL